jgi:hypothetical protein
LLLTQSNCPEPIAASYTNTMNQLKSFIFARATGWKKRCSMRFGQRQYAWVKALQDKL